jgi:hypothetical protein
MPQEFSVFFYKTRISETRLPLVIQHTAVLLSTQAE